jgi:Rod binding domain-containing protein
MDIPNTLTRIDPVATRQIAQQLETAFLSEMLKTGGLTPRPEPGSAESPFASFITDHYAQALVLRGGIGLAAQIERALSRATGDPT